MFGGNVLNSTIFVFLRKFLATLYLNGVRDIPFSGTEYNAGVCALQTSLNDMIPEEVYDSISDIFLKTPVQEEFNQFRDILIALNGDVIGFSAMKNPYWRSLNINMTHYYAEKVLNEDDVEIGISNEQFSAIANKFCEAAGVLIWERF